MKSGCRKSMCEEKMAMLRRHLMEEVPVSDVLKDCGINSAAQGAEVLECPARSPLETPRTRPRRIAGRPWPFGLCRRIERAWARGMPRVEPSSSAKREYGSHGSPGPDHI